MVEILRPTPLSIVSGSATAGRVPGYDMLNNMVNDRKECGQQGQQTEGDTNRVGYYQRYHQCGSARCLE
jgi:hypothetical protein